MYKSRPVLITFSILAGLQILANAGGLSEILGPKPFFLLGILVAAVQVGMTFFVQNATVPVSDTVAYVNQNGESVAGPAAGLTNGTPVDVVRTT